MKKSLLIALIAAVYLVTAGWNRAAAQGPSGTKVAVIDIAFVFENHPLFIKRLDAIKTEVTQFEAWGEQERNRLAGLAQQLTTIKAGTQPYRDLEARVASDSAQLQAQIQLKKKHFMELQAEAYFTSYAEVIREVTLSAERHGISLVLRFDGNEINPTDRASVLNGVNRAVVYQTQLNITALVLDSLKRGMRPEHISNRPQIPRVR